MDRANASHAADSSFDGVLGVDLGCPQCGYNLRGLAGPVAACPECGLRSDLGRLATQRWDKPWYQAPRFNTVVLPAVWVFVSLIGGVFYVMAISGVAGTPGVLLTLIYPVLAAASWAALSDRAAAIAADGIVGSILVAMIAGSFFKKRNFLYTF